MGPFFPYGTLAVNLIGSFALGFFFGVRERSLQLSPDLWLFLGTGLCGGFTTMSTFSLETLALVRERELYYAGLNVAATLAGCLAATAAGYLSARAFAGWAR
jgi:CrcB protein